MSEEIKKLIDLKDYEYVDENGFVCLKEGVNKWVDKYKYIRATRENILIEKGLVEKREEGGYTKLFAKSDSFTLEFDVTKEIKEEAIYHRWRTDFGALDQSGGDIPVTLEGCESKYFREGEIVVRGHFAPELGKHVMHYKKINDENNPFIVDFERVDEYTVIPFTVDKIYGESDLKVGDVIDVRYGRGISMDLSDNGYLTGYAYTFFDTCDEKERHYIASIKREKDGTYSTGVIFQKAELELNKHDYDTLYELLDDVAQKYN